MSNTLLKTALATSFVALATPAIAQDAYVFGTVGVSDGTHTIERNIGPNPPALSVPDAGGTSSVQEQGASFQIGAGYQFDLGDSGAFVAAEGFYGLEDIQSRNINGVLVTDVDVEARYGGRVLAGYNVSDDFSVYSHGGITWLDYDLTNSYTFAPPVTERSETSSAFSYGAGMRYRLSGNLSAVVDYTRVSNTDFDGIPEVAGGTGRVNRNTLAVDTLSTGLLFKF